MNTMGDPYPYYEDPKNDNKNKPIREVILNQEYISFIIKELSPTYIQGEHIYIKDGDESIDIGRIEKDGGVTLFFPPWAIIEVDDDKKTED